jgi:esterase/lipase
LHLAASEQITGIIMICAPAYVYPGMLPVARLVESFTPVPPVLSEDLRRSALSEHDTIPMAPVESILHYWPLLRTELPSVTAPFLIMTAVHDYYVVSARDAQAIYRSVGSQEKYLVKFGQSDCLLADDAGPEEVFARILDFIQSHACGV